MRLVFFVSVCSQNYWKKMDFYEAFGLNQWILNLALANLNRLFMTIWIGHSNVISSLIRWTRSIKKISENDLRTRRERFSRERQSFSSQNIGLSTVRTQCFLGKDSLVKGKHVMLLSHKMTQFPEALMKRLWRALVKTTQRDSITAPFPYNYLHLYSSGWFQGGGRPTRLHSIPLLPRVCLFWDL